MLCVRRRTPCCWRSASSHRRGRGSPCHRAARRRRRRWSAWRSCSEPGAGPCPCRRWRGPSPGRCSAGIPRGASGCRFRLRILPSSTSQSSSSEPSSSLASALRLLLPRPRRRGATRVAGPLPAETVSACADLARPSTAIRVRVAKKAAHQANLMAAASSLASAEGLRRMPRRSGCGGKPFSGGDQPVRGRPRGAAAPPSSAGRRRSRRGRRRCAGRDGRGRRAGSGWCRRRCRRRGPRARCRRSVAICV